MDPQVTKRLHWPRALQRVQVARSGTGGRNGVGAAGGSNGTGAAGETRWWCWRGGWTQWCWRGGVDPMGLARR